MSSLRRVHLCLGCFFAPLLVFFAASGLWQMFGGKRVGATLMLLSSIHTGRALKSEVLPTLSSSAMRWLVAAMALSLVLNIALGLVLAFRSPHRRAAAWSVFAGAAAPAALVVALLWRSAQALPGH